jgi:hypothetical protein
MDDGRIELAPAQVAEMGETAAKRLRKIAGGAAMGFGAITLACIAVVSAHPAALLDILRVIPTALALGGLSLERLGKAGVARRAARLASENPKSRWVLDGHRVLSLAPSPPLMFRLSKRMRRMLTAMPRATLVLK